MEKENANDAKDKVLKEFIADELHAVLQEIINYLHASKLTSLHVSKAPEMQDITIGSFIPKVCMERAMSLSTSLRKSIIP